MRIIQHYNKINQRGKVVSLTSKLIYTSYSELKDMPKQINFKGNTDDGVPEDNGQVLTTDKEKEYMIQNLSEDMTIRPVNMKGTYRVPQMGKSYLKYAESNLNLGLLKRGEREVLRFQATVNGHLTEDTYELIRTNKLTPESLVAINPKLSKFSAEPKYIFLKRRYYLDNNGLIHDHLRKDRVVCEPIYVFDMIMGCHLMNNHGSYKGVFHSLADFYSNITRDLVNKAIQFCSICNPDEKIERLEKYKHRNIYKSIMPLERIHLEIIEPFDGDKIEDKYSHILYARDYHSRYVWLLPLRSVRFKKLVNVIANFLLQLVRQPIFIETLSLDWQDMFDICEKVAEKYQMQIGLGTRKPNNFHAAGIRQIKRKLNDHKDECLSDWNMCLKYGPIAHNRAFSDRAGAIPSDLLCSEVHEIGLKFKDKVEQILDDSGSKTVVKIGNGLIYLEVSDGSDIALDDSEVENDEYHDNNEADNQDANGDTLSNSRPSNEDLSEEESTEEQTLVASNQTDHKRSNNGTASNVKRHKMDFASDEGLSMEI